MNPCFSPSRLVVALALLVGVCAFAFAFQTATPAQAISSTIVISQVYGGGGNADAPLNADFVELFNLGSTTQSLKGWSVQYAAADATTWTNGNKVNLPNLALAPGQRFLIQMSAPGENGAELPEPDASGAVAIANDAGKIALVSSTTLLTGSGCPLSDAIIDFVAYGSNTNCSETAPAPAASTTNAIARAQEGCIDTDDNQSDFATIAPNPRNTNAFFTPCFPPTATTTLTLPAIPTFTETPTLTETPAAAVTTPFPVSHLVISQVYPSSGMSGAAYQNDFVEVFNPDSVPISLSEFSLQYAATTGSTWRIAAVLPDDALEPGQYALIQLASDGANGAPLPAYDANSVIPLDPEGGKIALVMGNAVLSGSGCPFESSVIDFVGYGAETNCLEGSAALPAPEAAISLVRRTNGCQDTDHNAYDFALSNAAPRNGETPFNFCRATATPSPTITPTFSSTPTETATLPTFTLTSTPTATPTETENSAHTPTTLSRVATHMVISELRTSGPNGANDEFIEFYNPSSGPINLHNWKVFYSDEAGNTWQLYSFTLITVEPGRHFLLAHPGPDGYAESVASDANFSYGLADGGGIALIDSQGVVVDQVGWSTTSAYGEGVRLTPLVGTTDSSYERKPGGASGNCVDEDDNATDFLLNANSSNPQNLASPASFCPGMSIATPVNTHTPTPTITPTSTPTPFAANIRINEFLPKPASDWNGDGDINAQDEWIELYNPNAFAVDLSGWQLDDIADGGASPYVLPADTRIPAHGFWLVYGSESRITLNDNGDQAVRLLFPDNTLADLATYNASAQDASYARNPDGAGAFSMACVPTPRAPNCTITPTLTVTPTRPTASTRTGTPTRTTTPTRTFTPTSTPFAANIRINEFLPKPASDWNGDGGINARDEWIELYNPNAFAVDLSGWRLDDIAEGGASPYTLPADTRIPAHGFWLVYGSESRITLNDNGDQAVRLLFPDNTLADMATYNASAQDASYARNPDGAGAFSMACVPTPRAPNCTITPTVTVTPTRPTTPTHTITPTLTATSTRPMTPTHTATVALNYAVRDISINEIAWAGTAAAAADEWIELVNNTDAPILLNGWRLEAVDHTPDILLTGSIPAHGFFLLERTDDHTLSDIAADQIYTGALENTGETLILYDPTGKEIDTANSGGDGWDAGTTDPPCSMERIDSRLTDSISNWHTNDNLIRNGYDAKNQPVCGTPKNQNSTPAATATPSQTMTPTQTPTPTKTMTPTFTPVSGGLFVNEFMPNPARDWDANRVADEQDEWIEIYNANSFRVDLSGWLLDDVADGGSAPYVIPNNTKIKGHGYLVLYRADTKLVLNNSNDDVRLLRPDAVVADTIQYKSSDPDVAWSRNPDGAAVFTKFCAPSPDAANCSIAPTPTITPTPYAPGIVINEFLPAPYFDWNGDHLLDSGDEWVEIYNASTQTVDLGGWQLDDKKGGSSAFRIPDGTLVPAHGFRVFFASETKIGLNNDGDTVRLLHPNQTAADRQKYPPLETNKSYARSPDGIGAWSSKCAPTPGLPNCSRQPTATPTRQFSLTSIAQARTLPEGSRVSVLGSVVAHPCEIDTYGHAMMLSDGVAGIQVYLEYPSQLSCLIPRGEQMVVTGVLRDYFGLRTLYLASNQDIARHYAPPRAIAPLHTHTGEIGESTESIPLMIEGAVSNGKNGDVIWVNDGTGMVEVYADPASAATFEGITRGSLVRIYGVGYQNNQFTAPTEGYYLRPRAPDDIVVLELAEKLPNAPGGRGGVDLGAVSIEQALNTRTQNYVTIGGVVTVPPGVIAARNFWIQDSAGRGARIFVDESAGDMLLPELNESVTVRGRVVSAFGAREIRVELTDGISRHGLAPAIAPRTLNTGKIDFSNEGALVAIQGFVTHTNGREIYIDDSSGEVLVYIDATTRIRWSRLHPGDPARVVGVVTRFRGEPEILPRFQSDVQFGAALLPVAGKQNMFVPGLRAYGRVGEDSSLARRIQARAAVRLADHPGPVSSPPAGPAQARNYRELANDPLALVSLLLLGASGLSGVIAARKYRKKQRTT